MPRKKVEPINETMAPVSLRFTQPQMKRLLQKAKETGLPMTELVRRYVDKGLSEDQSPRQRAA